MSPKIWPLCAVFSWIAIPYDSIAVQASPTLECRPTPEGDTFYANCTVKVSEMAACSPTTNIQLLLIQGSTELPLATAAYPACNKNWTDNARCAVENDTTYIYEMRVLADGNLLRGKSTKCGTNCGSVSPPSPNDYATCNPVTITNDPRIAWQFSGEKEAHKQTKGNLDKSEEEKTGVAAGFGVFVVIVVIGCVVLLCFRCNQETLNDFVFLCVCVAKRNELHNQLKKTLDGGLSKPNALETLKRLPFTGDIKQEKKMSAVVSKLKKVYRGSTLKDGNVHYVVDLLTDAMDEMKRGICALLDTAIQNGNPPKDIKDMLTKIREQYSTPEKVQSPSPSPSPVP